MELNKITDVKAVETEPLESYGDFIRPLEFRGADLWCKRGFGDGDMLDDYLFDIPHFREFYDALDDLPAGVGPTAQFDSFCIMALVEIYLLPKFDRPVEIHHGSYSHNPCRAVTEEWWLKEQEEEEKNGVFDWEQRNLPTVKLQPLQIIEIMNMMMKVFQSVLIEKKPVDFPAALTQTAQALANEFQLTDMLISDEGT